MSRRLILILLLGALVAAGTAGFVLTRSSTGGGTSASVAVQKDQLLAYEHAVIPIVTDGGRVVQEGMKPAMDDLQYRHIVPAPMIAHEADGWLQSLADVRKRLAAVTAPAALQPPTATFLAALDGYRTAAASFRAAALAPAGPKRQALVTRGLDQARAADQTYDKGAAVVQGYRHRLGLAPSPYFPEGSSA